MAPDVHGFGESFDPSDPLDAYSAATQAAAVLELLGAFGIDTAVFAGCARPRPCPTPARPGRRVLARSPARVRWYQPFHKLDLSVSLLDGSYEAVHTYLSHFWTHWSGPSFTPLPAQLNRLAGLYARPGAFTASIGWYRAGSGTVATALTEGPPAVADRISAPTTVLWPAHDPLFPYAWSDQLDHYFACATLHRPLLAPRSPTTWAHSIRAGQHAAG